MLDRAYQDPGWPTRGAASAAFLGILCLVAALERLQYQLRETESSPWWASNGRDVLNLFAFGVLSCGLNLLGFQWPIAFLFAACMVILLTAVQGPLGPGRTAAMASVGVTIALGMPVLVAPRWVAQLAGMALNRLVP